MAFAYLEDDIQRLSLDVPEEFIRTYKNLKCKFDMIVEYKSLGALAKRMDDFVLEKGSMWGSNCFGLVDRSILAEMYLDKWPHQTFAEAIAASLFYPTAVDKVLEQEITNRNRYKIACSARYKNPIAIRELAQACEVEKVEPASKKQKLDHYKTDLEEEWKRYLSDIENHDAEILPHYRVAELKRYNLESGMCWYERGAVYDKRCRYKLGIFTIIPEEKRIATLEKLWREDKMAAAATMLGKIYYGNKDYDRAAKYYKYAREQNDPAGWYATGHMIKSKELVLENLTYLDCWEQAGNLGYDMGYYSMLQSIDLRSEERRRRVLEAQVKLGVEAEMITLGKDYFNEGRKEEGLSLLMNAGVDGARALESMIKEGVLKRENVQEHLKNTTRANMIRDLRSLSKLE